VEEGIIKVKIIANHLIMEYLGKKWKNALLKLISRRQIGQFKYKIIKRRWCIVKVIKNM